MSEIKIALCANMSGFFLDLIEHIENAGNKIIHIFLMDQNYYKKNIEFFDKMIELDLSFNIAGYLDKTGQDYTTLDGTDQTKFSRKLEKIKPDIIVNNGMMHLFPKAIVNSYKIINTHSGGLPFYRGRCGASWALYNGESKYGLTCHLMDENFDTGPILAQKEIIIDSNDYVYDLLLKEKKAFPPLIMEAINKVTDEGFIPKKQSEFEGSYFPSLNSSIDGVIDWNLETSTRICNKIKAFSKPYQGAFTIKGEKKYTISKASPPESNEFICSEPGLIFGKTEEGYLKVSTKDGFIIIQNLIYEGKEINPSECWKLGQYVYNKPLKTYFSSHHKMISSDLIEKYQKDGAVVLRHAIDKRKICQLKHEIFDLLSEIDKTPLKYEDEDEAFIKRSSEVLWKIVSRFPEKRNLLYKYLQRLPTLMGMADLDVVKGFVESIGIKHPRVRELKIQMYLPWESLFFQPCHQDINSLDAERSATIYIPLHHVPEYSAVTYWKGSHLQGPVKHEEVIDEEKGVYHVRVPKIFRDLYPNQEKVLVDGGDIICINRMAFHSSPNWSNQLHVRFTIIVRYDDLTESELYGETSRYESLTPFPPKRYADEIIPKVRKYLLRKPELDWPKEYEKRLALHS